VRNRSLGPEGICATIVSPVLADESLSDGNIGFASVRTAAPQPSLKPNFPASTELTGRQAGTRARTVPCRPYAHDGVLRLLQPDRDPEAIKPKRTYARRTRYFARNELSRLCSYALREANGERMTTERLPLALRRLTKGFDGGNRAMQRSIRDAVLAVLRSFRKQL
jgi:hypothetical protein